MTFLETYAPALATIRALMILLWLLSLFLKNSSIVDIFWVAKLGSDAAAAVGVTESLMTLLYSMAAGIGMATTAMVARRIGEKDVDGAGVAAVQSLVLGLGAAPWCSARRRPWHVYIWIALPAATWKRARCRVGPFLARVRRSGSSSRTGGGTSRTRR